MARTPARPAQSNYRQVRLTVTEEEGWVSIRVLAKPLAAKWDMKNSVYHHRVRRSSHTHHWTNLLAWAVDTLMSERFPDA